MRQIIFTAVLLAGFVILTSCTRLPPSATPTPSFQPPAATKTPTAADTPQRAVTPSTSPPGLTLSNPATFYTPVEHPQMIITLVGMELPASFPSVTPDPGYRFVAPQLSFLCQLPADTYCQRVGSFELIDSQGTRHSPAIAVSGEGFISKEDFLGGTLITGGMVFMVPIATDPFILRYIGYQGREAFFQIE